MERDSNETAIHGPRISEPWSSDEHQPRVSDCVGVGGCVWANRMIVGVRKEEKKKKRRREKEGGKKGGDAISTYTIQSNPI